MSYTPTRMIKAADMDRAERNFRLFLGCSTVVLILVITGMTVKLPTVAFWEGNRLWTLGSLLVFLTVVHGRYFEVAKKSNPDFGVQPERPFTPWIKAVEGWIHHAWVTGSILLFIARFVPY